MSIQALSSLTSIEKNGEKKKDENVNILLLLTHVLLGSTNSLLNASVTQSNGVLALADAQQHLTDEIGDINSQKISDYEKNGQYIEQRKQKLNWWERLLVDVAVVVASFATPLTPVGGALLLSYLIPDNFNTKGQAQGVANTISDWNSKAPDSRDTSVWIDGGYLHVIYEGMEYRIKMKPGETVADIAKKMRHMDVDFGRYDGENNEGEIDQEFQVNQMQQSIRNVYQGENGVVEQLCGEMSAHLDSLFQSISTVITQTSDILSTASDLTRKIMS